jgi:predicted RNA-binding Zn-ribbon protein involved in translation (DUF1610 family)
VIIGIINGEKVGEFFRNSPSSAKEHQPAIEALETNMTPVVNSGNEIYTVITRSRKNNEPIFVPGAKPGDQPMSASSWYCEKCGEQHITTLMWTGPRRQDVPTSCQSCGEVRIMKVVNDEIELPPGYKLQQSSGGRWRFVDSDGYASMFGMLDREAARRAAWHFYKLDSTKEEWADAQ